MAVGPAGTPQRPNLPPLRRMQLVDADGNPTPMFLQFLQQLFTSGPTIAANTFLDAVLSVPAINSQVQMLGQQVQMGVATLVAGTVTVTNGNTTAASRIFLTGQNVSGTPGDLTVTNRVPGTGFDILSSSAADTRDVAWLLIEPTEV